MGQPDFAKLFQVTSLPRFAVIDGQGYILAVGSTLGVLRAIDGLVVASTSGKNLTAMDPTAQERPSPPKAPTVLGPNRFIQQSAETTGVGTVPAAE